MSDVLALCIIGISAVPQRAPSPWRSYAAYCAAPTAWRELKGAVVHSLFYSQNLLNVNI